MESENDEKTIGNIVECLYRVYRVQTPDGLILEVKSDEKLSNKLLQQLIKEDIDVDNFFKHRTILGVRRLVKSPDMQKKTNNEEIVPHDGQLTRRQRLNALLKMKGIFTRNDYIKYLSENFNVKIARWTSYNDVRDALKINRLEIVEGEQKGSTRKYRVIDAEEIGESLFKKLLEDRKHKIDILA